MAQSMLDVNVPDWLKKRLFGTSGRGLPFSPQYGVDEPGRGANISQYVDEQIGSPLATETQVAQQPMMQRTDVAGHLDQISRIQANRNKWDARTRAFGGNINWSSLPDITKEAKYQDEMIRDEITSRLTNAILSGEVMDIGGAMSWFKTQGFDKHFEGDARKAATAILDQIMQEGSDIRSKEAHVMSQETRDEQRTKFEQSQLDRTSAQAADLQKEKVQNKIGEMISDNSQAWAEDSGDYDKAEYREREIRYDAQQLEGYSESEKETIFSKVMEGLQGQTAQVGRYDVAQEERSVAQESDRLRKLSREKTERGTGVIANERENEIVNAGVDMLNNLVQGGMDQQQAINQVVQQMSDWGTDRNFQGLTQEAGEWVPRTAPAAVEGGLQAPRSPEGSVPLDISKITQDFFQQTGTRGEQASAIKGPAAVEWVTNAIGMLKPTENPAQDLLNMNTMTAAELQKGGAQNPLWYNFTLPKRQGIAMENVLSYIEMSQPGRIDRNKIMRDFETGEALAFIMELRKQEQKASKSDRAAIRDRQDEVLNEYIDTVAKSLNIPRKFIDYILFPEHYEIGIGIDR